VSRPANLSTLEFFALRDPQRKAHLAELQIWEESPEGIAEKAAKQAAEKARYEALIRPAIRAKLLEVGVPRRALDVFDHEVQVTPALTAVKNALDMLVLLGGCGTGKTVAGVASLREYVSDPRNWKPGRSGLYRGDESDDLLLPMWRGLDPVWTTAADLARSNHYDRAEFERIAKASRLVIDDLGAEFNDAKGFLGSYIDEIINIRYSSDLPVVITTNLDVDAFKARYGMRIIDRIREGGRFVACGAVSLRRRPAP
jgi:hypothetical protein